MGGRGACSCGKRGKRVDISEKSDIIEAGSDNVALEYQRYGRNKNTLVNKTYIDGGEYRRKFDQITNNADVNRVVYLKAKEMLKHRSGTMIEDMYWIDPDTGEIVASALNEQQDSAVIYSQAVKEAVEGRKGLLAMHTHPQSMPPSAADFNAACRHEYKTALVICHDGTVFQYTANEIIDTDLYNAYVQKYIKSGCSEFDAQINALKKLKENYDIDFWEAIP